MHRIARQKFSILTHCNYSQPTLIKLYNENIGGHLTPLQSLQRSRSYTGCRSSTVSPSILLLSCIRLSTVDARRTSLTSSCLLRPTRMHANFVPPVLEPPPSNEAGRSSEGVPSQWPAQTYGTVSPPPSVPSTPTQPSVVR